MDELNADAIRITGPRTLEFGPPVGAPPWISAFTLIQGRWTVIAQVKRGGFLLESQRGKWIEFDQNIMRSDWPATPLYEPFLTETGFVIDSSARPAHFDLPDIGATGIFWIDGDTLAIADAGQPRPTEFVSRSGSLVTLTFCRRANLSPSKAGGVDSVVRPPKTSPAKDAPTVEELFTLKGHTG